MTTPTDSACAVEIAPCAWGGCSRASRRATGGGRAGWYKGVQEGAAEGNKAAGPVGGVLGGAIGGVVGVFTGVLGVGKKRQEHPRQTAGSRAGSAENGQGGQRRARQPSRQC